MKSGTVVERARELPVLREVDVVVAGGGTAGMMAGLAAARAGAKTLVLERLNCLGGNFTAGLMTTTWTMNDQQNLVVKGLPLELIQLLEKNNATIVGNKSKDAFVNYDTEKAKFILNDMYLAEKNLEVLYYTWVSDVILEDGCVKGVVVECKSGRRAILADIVVDATGDADVAAFAGAEYMKATKEKLHPVSLLAKIANVDSAAVHAYYQAHPDQIGNFLRGLPHAGFHSFRLDKELAGVELPADLEYLKDWFLLFYSTPHPSEFIINMTGVTEVDGNSVEDLSRAEMIARKRLEQALTVFRLHMPGFKDAYFTATASTLGVRETRRIVGLHVLNRAEVLGCAKFDDAVCCYHAPVADHTADGKNITFTDMVPGTTYDIPLRCLIPKAVDKLIVTGRSISVEVDIIGTIRNMTCCMALGQAAGIAAALASKTHVSPRDIESGELRRALLSQDVYLSERRL